MLTNAKIKIYPVGIYLLKVNNKNFRGRCVNCSQLTEKTPEWPHLHRDIKKRWRPSGVLTVNFGKILHLFSAFHCWIWWALAAGFTNRDQCIDIKNYETFEKCEKCRLWANMRNLLRFSFCKNNFFIGK